MERLFPVFTSTFFPPALLPLMSISSPLSMARVSLAVTVLPVWVIVSSAMFPLDFPALMPTFWSPPIPKEAVPLLLLFPSAVFLFSAAVKWMSFPAFPLIVTLNSHHQ